MFQCGFESARVVVYLDIQLPVRPFGATTHAYGSVVSLAFSDGQFTREENDSVWHDAIVQVSKVVKVQTYYKTNQSQVTMLEQSTGRAARAVRWPKRRKSIKLKCCYLPVI